MNSKTQPFSAEDIHTILSNASIDVANIVVHIDLLRERQYSLPAIFGENFSLILFLPNPDPEVAVGHFVLLSHLSDNTLEYFDSYAGEVPEAVRELAKRNNMRIKANKVRYQEEVSMTCAKWCVARIFSLPSTLAQFEELYTGHKLSPDVLVNNLFRLKKPR